MLTTVEIRSQFLDYFKKNGHTIVPSGSLVPHNDPTLMFSNAGMNQFKNVFTGLEKREYKTATTAQKCVRAGGKHNDLDNVGYTARHHTFFEMLGNFSFGDYFKEEAISLAWNLITQDWKVPQEKLLVTVYAEDEDAATLWKKISGLNDERIIRISSKAENFWTMGDTGPCGPCSEIFYDHGAHIPGGPPGSPDADGDRFVEIWNLVFMQYEQLSPEELVNLPRPSIDTGMGLERIAAVLQGVHNNYDTDIFKSIIEASEEITKVKAKGVALASHRVIADHLRAVSFLMADGVLPSNEGRGYVLRRIMRRAMRHVQMMGYKDALLAKLVPVLIEKMGMAYPELNRAYPLIVETLLLEDKRFRQTLERGLKLLEEETATLKSGANLSGEVAFKLYDTYGFPLDLTQDVLKTQNRNVDLISFQDAMERQKAEARKAWAGSGESKTEGLWFDLREKHGATEFLGYASDHASANILSLIQGGQEINSAKAGDIISIITNQTPFYGEGGGQMGDTGLIIADSGKIEITDTLKKLGDLIVHQGRVLEGEIRLSQSVDLSIDLERRSVLRANHSATHLLHTALRTLLGSHVTQKGSLVAPDRLRFDFSHPKGLSFQDIEEIESNVNAQIRKNAPVGVRLMSADEAIETGALALFGEKYGDEVRVISMGISEEGSYSTELCGGTHVDRTGDIGYFKIISEIGIASGVRRIEALTGKRAEDYVRAEELTLSSLCQILKTPDVLTKVSALLEDKKKLERDIQNMRQQLVKGGASGGSSDIQKIGDFSYVSRQLKDVPAKDLKPIVDGLKEEIRSGIVVVASDAEGKVSLVVGVTADLTSRFSAVDLIREASPALGGQGGGGRADIAQAGGPNASGIPEAFKRLEERLRA
ncbi:Alanine--tRNA ligase [Candidatus Bealeia paramacronuclearis]|uniref:Alanine--tRNA ligase n=1 Tax=Candidatus Bealeia paramacronuclearis TaxID=1921001 RepID=A0ABZ2C276_9PROT|nr:Alanine--tRNA ligase [Candidatus Bealeia paramacronuclearis]